MTAFHNLDPAPDIVKLKFTSQGGIYESLEYGLKIFVPHDAVGEGEILEMKILPQLWGPFSVSDKYLLITPYYWIILSLPIHKPIQISMKHCLKMPKYQKSKEVVILKADHDVVNGSNLYCFEPIPNLDISVSDTQPELSFQIQNSYILCGALESGRANNENHERSSKIQRQCQVVYTLLLFEPEDDQEKQKPFNILIYACQSCSFAIQVSFFFIFPVLCTLKCLLQECMKQAKERLKYEFKVTAITDVSFDTGTSDFELKPNTEYILPKNDVVVSQSEMC